MPRKIGGYQYPYNPPRGNWSGILKEKSRRDVMTLTGNVSLNWGFKLGDAPVREEWPLMEETFYQQLRDLYTENDGTETYTYEIAKGEKYTVEIISLLGIPFIKDSGVRYYRNVVMELKLLEVVED